MNKSKILLILLLSLMIFMISSNVAPIVSAQSDGSGIISGTAWIDANCNGMQEPSEELASHAIINVRPSDQGLTHTTTTDEFGVYIFTNLSFGIYLVNGVEHDGTMTAERTVELNEVNGAANVDVPMKKQAMTYQFLPVIRR